MENELKIEAEKLSPQEQFMLRKQIVALRKKGKTTAEVVEILGVKKRHIQATWKNYSEGGLKAIALKKMGRPKGENKKLTRDQEKEIQKLIIDKCPNQLKLRGFLWDIRNVCNLIKTMYYISMPNSTMSVFLKRWGFTSQRPSKQNYKQQPEQIKKWLDEEYPVIKNKAKSDNGEIFWGDETGVQNETNYVKGYAPKGETPILKVDTSKLRINMISAINNQGKIRFMIYKENMNQQKLIEFMERLLKDTTKKVFLILDNLKVHHGKIVTEWLSDKKNKIEVFYLPSYAPEYNPDEYLNGNLKRDIASKEHAHTLSQMESNALSFMEKMESDADHVKSFFKHKKLFYIKD